MGKCKHGITLLYLFPQKCYHYTNSILQKKDIHMKFLILLIIALVISSIGFKKIVWFISLGYCFSIAGIGVGLIVRQGGSAGGDDALALTISRVTHWRLSRAYLFTDLTVLALSLTYIPVGRIACSLVTVTLSSFLIDRIQTAALPRRAAEAE